MRYLTSISLALIVLMALACTDAPTTPAPTSNIEATVQARVAQERAIAEPTPNIDGTVEARLAQERAAEKTATGLDRPFILSDDVDSQRGHTRNEK